MTHLSPVYTLKVLQTTADQKAIPVFVTKTTWHMLPLSLYNYFRLFGNHVTLFKDSRVFLSGLLSLMGTSDMNSTPPAITVSH